MEFRTWLYCIVFSCIVIKCFVAKPFSLNKAIAAESQENQADITHRPKLAETTAERFSLNKALTHTSLKPKKPKEIERIVAQGKKISPLKYRKTFLIKSPLKPKKLKYTSKLRSKRKNQSIKREINSNEKLNQKYIPLLKSIGMLFDNLLGSDTSDSYEVKKRKHKRNRYYPDERDGVVCTCALEPNANNEDYTSHQKAATPASTLTTEVAIDTETTTAPTDYTPVGDVSGIKQHKNVPVLLPRDTVSSRRDYTRVSEGSRTAHNWSIEGNIPGDHGDREYNAKCRENEPNTQSNEEFAHCSPRNDANGDGSYRGDGNRNDTRSANLRIKTDEDEDVSKDESTAKVNRDSYELKGEDKLEIGGDETKSATSLSKLVRRLRGFRPEDKISADKQPIQPDEVYEESVVNITHDNAGHKRITDGSRTNTEENQKVRARNEAVITVRGSPKLNFTSSQTPNNKSAVVMIIDGYSVTRHKNGDNKLSKKAIHIHS